MTRANSEFSERLTAAVARRGLPLATLAARLRAEGRPISVAALSHWSSGRSIPERSTSIDALVVLEEILQLPPGHLTDILPGRRRRGRSPATARLSEISETEHLLEGVLGELGFDSREDQPWETSVHARLVVDEHGLERHIDYRHVLKLLRPGPVRFPSIHTVELGPDDLAHGLAPGRVEPGAGCRLGRVVVLPEEGLIAAELIADAGAEAGDFAIADHRVILPETSVPSSEASYTVARRARDIVLQAEFHPDAVPRSAMSILYGGDRSEEHGIRISAEHRIQAVFQDVGPGTAGLTWRW